MNMNNQRYVKVVRGRALYFVREDVWNVHDHCVDDPYDEHFMLLTLSDFVVKYDRFVKKAKASASDMIINHIQNSLESIVITEAQFESEKIKEHYLEF